MYWRIVDVVNDVVNQLLEALSTEKTEPDIVKKFVDSLKQRPYSNGIIVTGNRMLKVRSAVIHQRPYVLFNRQNACNRRPCNVSRIELGDILYYLE